METAAPSVLISMARVPVISCCSIPKTPIRPRSCAWPSRRGGCKFGDPDIMLRWPCVAQVPSTRSSSTIQVRWDHCPAGERYGQPGLIIREVQTLRVDATSGQFIVDGMTGDALDYNASETEMETALAPLGVEAVVKEDAVYTIYFTADADEPELMFPLMNPIR